MLSTILSIIGIITLFTIAYFFWRRYLHYRVQRQKASETYPPEQYMRHVGIFCPDYWTYLGNGVCENTFNVPIHDPSNASCLDSGATNKRTFNNISDFPVKKGDLRLKSRCDWIENCGTKRHTKGIWSGVEELCPVKE